MTKPLVSLTSVGDESLPELVLVHGWGHNSTVWQSLIDELDGRFRIHLLDLPGYGAGQDEQNTDEQAWTLEGLLDEFVNLPIGSAIWCGWSLGGMLAAYHAACYPTRVRGLLTIASNACFVQRNDWLTAMPQLDYERFEQSLHDDSKATLGRFLGLIAQGSDTARSDLRTLKGCVKQVQADEQTLVSSLNLLHELDTRPALASLAMPQCHLFGEHDALVPVSSAPAVGLLNGRADIRVVEGAGHALFLSHPQSVVDALADIAELL